MIRRSLSCLPVAEPVEAPPVEAPPVEAPPVEAPPVEAPPVEAPPVEAPEGAPWFPELLPTEYPGVSTEQIRRGTPHAMLIPEGSAGTVSAKGIIVFTSLAAAAPAFHGGLGLLLPLFIIGHVVWFVIIVLVIILVVTVRRRRLAQWGAAGHFGPWAQAARGAESTLAERFAQGDIDEKEYRARLEVLRANASQRHPMG